MVVLYCERYVIVVQNISFSFIYILHLCICIDTCRTYTYVIAEVQYKTAKQAFVASFSREVIVHLVLHPREMYLYDFWLSKRFLTCIGVKKRVRRSLFQRRREVIINRFFVACESFGMIFCNIQKTRKKEDVGSIIPSRISGHKWMYNVIRK